MKLNYPTLNRFELFEIIRSYESAFKWCQDKGIIMKDPKCPNCGELLALYSEEKVYRCNNQTCQVEMSVFSKSIFSRI